MSTIAKEVINETAATLVASVLELAGNQTAVDERVQKVLISLIAGTTELLLSGDASSSKVALALAQRHLSILGISQHDAVLCAGTLVSITADSSSYSKMAGLGPAGVTVLAAIVLKDALDVYGQCYLPAREYFLVQEAEAKALQNYKKSRASRTRALSSAELAKVLDRMQQAAGQVQNVGAVLP